MATAGCIRLSGSFSLSAGSSLAWGAEPTAAARPCLKLRKWNLETVAGLHRKETRFQALARTSHQGRSACWRPLRCNGASTSQSNQACLLEVKVPGEAAMSEPIKEDAQRVVRAGAENRKVGARLQRALGQALLAAYLVSAPFAPPPAEALELQVLPNANIVGAAARQAATLAKGVQQNKIFEQAAEQMELQARSLLSPEVHDFLNQTREYLHIPTTEAISANIDSSIQSFEASSEQIEKTFQTAADQLAAGVSLPEAAAPALDSIQSAAQQLAAGVSAPALQRLREALAELAGGVKVDEALGKNIEGLRGALEGVGQGGRESVREGLRTVQGSLTAFQESVASGDHKLNEPMQQALGNAQNSIAAALTYLEKLAGEALNLIPIRSPSLTAAAQGTIERLGMFELFGLVWGFIVAQGERLIIFGPGLLLVAAGWNAFKKRQREKRRLEKRLLGPSPAALLRGARVQRALLKLQVKGQLFNAVRRLGRAALAPSSDPTTPSLRQDVEALIKQLSTLRTEPEPAVLGTSDSDPFADISPAPDIDGKWQLIYSTEPLETRGLSPGQFAELLPAVVMNDVIQRVTSREQGSLSTGVPQPAPVRVAENSANVSLGGVGTFGISVQGRWEDHENDVASVSFDTFSVHPLELFGRKFEGIPQVPLPVPTPLQQSIEWSTLYIDEDTRISQSKRGTFYLFTRLPG